jgi:prevent-host-death family protein
MAMEESFMERVSIAELKDRVSEFVARVERGEELMITRHGKEAARLVPPKRLDPGRLQELVRQTVSNREAVRAATGALSAGEVRRWMEEDRA